jgi:hypothetical protein
MNAGARDRVKLEWQANIIENNNIDNMNEALISLFLSTIEPAFRKHLDHDLVGRTASNFWTIFDSFLTKYGKVTPINLENKKDRMRAPYNAETPIETLFGQINDANEYSIFAKKPMQESDLIQAGEVLILRAGAFASEYKDWRSINEVDRTWEFFQEW